MNSPWPREVKDELAPVPSAISKAAIEGNKGTTNEVNGPTLSTFLLLRLPGETRTEIYQYLLCEPDESVFWKGGKWNELGKYVPSLNHSYINRMTGVVELLTVNSQIYHEALDILYGCNTFYLKDSLVFLRTIGQAGRSHLLNVSIDYFEGRDIPNITEYLARAASLRRLVIHIDQAGTRERIIGSRNPIIQAIPLRQISNIESLRRIRGLQHLKMYCERNPFDKDWHNVLAEDLGFEDWLKEKMYLPYGSD
ncbi:MAG: hypothetical protein M1836_004169 [Candelina mexicana]|nr:MAG: hypothetical protein M1836_004169 [Candelina mexicana]